MLYAARGGFDVGVCGMAGDESNTLPQRPKLFSSYGSICTAPSTVSAQIMKYIESTIECDNVVSYWSSETVKKDFPKLFSAAIRALSVPASSAPIERVFSQGGLIVRPNRASMNDNKVSALMFLKCNSYITSD